MTEDPPDDALHASLRSSLRAHADRAPLDGDVVARTLVAAHREPEGVPARRRRDWRTWGLPVLAAGAVAAVVGVVIVVQQGSRHDSAPTPADVIHSSAPSTGSAPIRQVVPVPTVTRTVTAPATAPPASPTSTVLHGVQVRDLTFVSADHGWALGTADCLVGSGRCTAVLRTTDGHTWRGIPGGTFKVPGVLGCADLCVQHLRFATDTIGYAYGPDALFMTTDGGASWHRQGSLGADALETAGSNAVLVRLGAQPLFERAPVGSSTWTAITSPPVSSLPTGATQVWLSRSGQHAALLFADVHSGGSTSRLYRSSDDGTTWRTSEDPCAIPRPGDSVSSAMAIEPDATVDAACLPATNGPAIVSVLAGHTQVRFIGRSVPDAVQLLAAPSDGVLVAVTAHDVYRSGDGGQSWTRVSQVSGSVIFLGFENEQTGRVVTDGGRSIYTTHDAGRTWSKAVLS